MSGFNNQIRIVLAKEEDFDEYFAIRCEKSDIYWMGHQGEPNYDMLRTVFMERLEGSSLEIEGNKRIYLIMNNSNIIGFVMLSKTNSGIELGISIKSIYQKSGFGSKAIHLATVEALKYSSSVYARIRDDNIASQSAFKKNSFYPTNDYEVIEYPIAGRIKFRKYLHCDKMN